MTSPLPGQCGDHTPEPAGYLAWHGWAEKMSKTHRQKRCLGCGLWKVWAKRTTGDHQ